MTLIKRTNVVQGQIDASEKDADGASPVDEQRIKMEMAKMRERGDW